MLEIKDLTISISDRYLIKNLNFRSNKYEKHVDKVKTILIEFLQKNVIN